MIRLKNILLALFATGLFTVSCSVTKGHKEKNSATLIKPGDIWPDNNDNNIQAHGGGIIKLGDSWYWFGEYRGKDLQPGFRYVGCYVSKDLAHWTFLNKIKFSAPEGFGKGWILERPKVFYNKKTGKYVMYFHLDDRYYSRAEVGVALSERVDSGYHFVNHFRPFGMESRDIGQFIDDNGTPYLIFENRPSHGFVIASLTDDYLNVKRKVCLVDKSLEGGAIVHYKGLYYVIGSHLTGWRPNPNVFATAKKLEGPWSAFKEIAPESTDTYGAQSSNLLKIKGSKETMVIFIGDIWKPEAQWNSAYLWMPLELGNGKMHMPKPEPWQINVKTGKFTIIKSSK